MNDNKEDRKATLSRRSKGRPRLEEYTEIEHLTDRMKLFCEGVSSGQMPSQVGASLGVGVGQIEAWLENVAIKEYIKELNYKRDRADEMSFFEESEMLDREVHRELKYSMIRRLKKDEVPWSVSLELDKLFAFKYGGLSPPVTTEVEATEEQEELTTYDLLKGREEDLKRLKEISMDPRLLPGELGGGGRKRKIKRRSLKVTKKED